MIFLKNRIIRQRIFVCVLPIVSLVALYFASSFILNNFTLPSCMTYMILGIYCPGCGCTRAVQALVDGNILLSLRQNASVIIGIISALLIYSEYFFKAFGIKISNPFRNHIFVWVFIIALALYYILRNFIPVLAPI